MTKENKELLMKYLCMASPYDVIVDYENHIYILNEVNPACKDMDYITVLIQDVERLMCAENEMIEDIKPYLRPMSSMTEEELKEFQEFRNITPLDWLPLALDWLLEYHFDFMGLIPKDLAIEVTEENNPYEN